MKGSAGRSLEAALYRRGPTATLLVGDGEGEVLIHLPFGQDAFNGYGTDLRGILGEDAKELYEPFFCPEASSFLRIRDEADMPTMQRCGR